MSMPDTKILSIDFITSNPNVRGGRPCIADTSIRVSDVVMVMLFHAQDPDGLAEWFDLPLTKIYAALSYYYAHKAEIDTDLHEQIAMSRDLKEKAKRA